MVRARKSLGKRVVFTLLGILLTSLCVSLFIQHSMMKKSWIDAKSAELEAEFRKQLGSIDTFIDNMRSHAKSLANMGEWLYRLKLSNPEIDAANAAMGVCLAQLEENKRASLLGGGLWFEPYTIEKSRKWVGPYAYYDMPVGTVRTTWEYSGDDYRYTEHGWYKIAVPQDWDRSAARPAEVYTTDPYMDSLEGKPTIFITCTNIMYGPDGRIIGVSTADWTLDSIAKSLDKFRLTEGSSAILLATSTRKLLFPTLRDKLMSLEELPWGAAIDDDKIRSGVITRIDGVEAGGRKNILLLTRTKNDYIFGSLVPTDEAYSALGEIARLNSFLAAVTIVLATVAILLFVRNILRPVKNLTEAARLISAGDFNRRAEVLGEDEIGELAVAFNNAYDRLKASEERFRSLFENAPDAIFVVDHVSGRIVDANRSAEHLFGRGREELFSSGFGEIVLPVRSDGDHPADPSQGAGLLPGEGELAVEERDIRTKDGGVIPCEVRIMRLPSAEGNLMRVSCIDISGRKRAQEMEKRISQAQRLEAIGTLSGGIAHDFNNILGAVNGYIEISLDMTGDQKVREYLLNALQASSRASELVRQLLTFSRQKSGNEAIAMEAGPIISETLKFLKAAISPNIAIENKMEGAPWIEMDPSEFQRILINLCTNSALAIGKGKGTISVTAEEVAAPDGEAYGALGLKSGRYLHMRIADDGCGMGPDVVERIFEPFFTTRAEGEGTGLGLSVVHGIVTKRGGAISVRSEPGAGTAFDIFLPSIEGGGGAAGPKEQKTPEA